jgi:[acyl-carrier-protein] S-malonyltransferase
MRTAFLFPGQGAQTVGMGADLYNNFNVYKQTFDACMEGAQLDLKAACFEGANMDGGEMVQPAIFAHSVSLLKLITDAGVKAQIYAGLSLGEYSALCAAGVIGAAQGAALVRERGRIMDSAFAPGEGGMLSVIGFAVDDVKEAITGVEDAYVANHLSDKQIVIAGKMAPLQTLKEKFEQMGAKMVTLLAVAGPSHAPLLQGASEAFSKVLEAVTLSDMQGTVYANALGAPYGSGSDIKALLAEQMRSRVRWHDCIEHMIESGVEQFVEIGPSNVLSKMLKRRVDKGTQVHSVRDAATLEKFLNTCEVQS